MDNALAVLWVLGVGVYLGAKLHEAWSAMPAPHLPAEPEERRATQAVCRCSQCQPPYWQESPAEVQ